MGRGRSSMTGSERAAGLRLLAQLAMARLTLVRIVAILPSLCAPSWQPAAVALRQRISSGERLSVALAAAVPDLPRHLLAIVRAGEDSATLAAALDRAAHDAEQAELRRRELLQSLSYPSLLIASGLVCIVIIATVVLPRFEEILLGLGQELPASAQLLVRVVQHAPHGLSVLGIVVVGAATTAHVRGRGASLRNQLGELMTRLPIVASLVRLHAIERVCAMLATLLECGVPIPRALTLASRGASGRSLVEGLSAARESVVRGSALSVALERSDVLPSGHAQLLRVGEETGGMVAALGQVARLAGDQRNAEIQRMIRLIEPTVLLGVALFVGGVAAVLMQTIYSVRPLQ